MSAVAPNTVRAAHAREQVFAPVLIYHHVKWLKSSDDAIERGLTVLPSQFTGQLHYLAAHRYHTVTAAQLVDSLRGGAPLPAHPVVLTFDDGYTDVYHTAYSELRRLHMHATFFIVPGFLNTPRYLTWSQVGDMAAHGMDMEAHTMTHPDLTTVGPAQLRNEVAGSRAVLIGHLHRAVRLFAYPYGAYDSRVLSAVRSAGYWAAFTTHQGWWESSAGLLELPRVYVDLDDTPSIFAGRLRADPAVLAGDPA